MVQRYFGRHRRRRAVVSTAIAAIGSSDRRLGVGRDFVFVINDRLCALSLPSSLSQDVVSLEQCGRLSPPREAGNAPADD